MARDIGDAIRIGVLLGAWRQDELDENEGCESYEKTKIRYTALSD